jgi:hypothetical protein
LLAWLLSSLMVCPWPSQLLREFGQRVKAVFSHPFGFIPCISGIELRVDVTLVR